MNGSMSGIKKQKTEERGLVYILEEIAYKPFYGGQLEEIRRIVGALVNEHHKKNNGEYMFCKHCGGIIVTECMNCDEFY